MSKKLIYLLFFVLMLVFSVLMLGLVGVVGVASGVEGLLGEYYHGSAGNPWQTLVMERIDPRVDFNWGGGSPDPSVNANNFTVRWTGMIEVPTTDTYTFHTQTDDGVRLFVNGQPVIDNWTNHSNTHDNGDITLMAGQPYEIILEFYESGGDAVCELTWSTPSLTRDTIPSQYMSVERPYARRPDPADGAILRDTWVSFSWTAGDYAASQDVYLGENFDDVDAGTGDTFQGNQAGTYFTIGFPGFLYPDGLVPGTTYYWRIDEIEADGNTKYKGPVWSFAVTFGSTNSVPSAGFGLKAVLGEIGDPQAIQPLIKALGDESEIVRQAAAAALGKIGDSQAVQPLIKALGDGEVNVREYAAMALGEIGDPQAVQPLIKALGDRNSNVRLTAAAALGEIGDPRAVQPLIKALGDRNEIARLTAVAALGEIGDPRAVQPLIKALGDRVVMVRRSAANALCEIGDPQAVQPLIKALGDRNGGVRQQAAISLGKIGDPRAVQPLIKALGDENERVRWSAATGLGEIGDSQTVQPLIKALGDRNRGVRLAAAEALGKISDPRAVQPLNNALKDENERVRINAARALKQIKSKVTPEDWQIIFQ